MMREILFEIVYQELKGNKNVLGWLLTFFTFALNNIEHVNMILTAILSTVSILFVIVRIYIAISNYLSGKKS